MTPLTRLLDRFEALLRIRGGILTAGMVGAVALTWAGTVHGSGPGSGLEPALGVFLPGAVMLGVLATTGVVSGDLRRGVVLLWVTKPGSGVRLYLERFLERLILGGALALVLLGAQAVTLGVAGDLPAARDLLLRGVPVTPVPVLLGAAMTWLLSSGGVQGDGALALLLLPVWTLSGTLLEGAPVPEAVVRLVGGTAPPAALFRSLPGVLTGGGFPSPAEVLHLLAWVVGVTAAGAALLSVRLRAPLPGEPSR